MARKCAGAEKRANRKSGTAFEPFLSSSYIETDRQTDGQTEQQCRAKKIYIATERGKRMENGVLSAAGDGDGARDWVVRWWGCFRLSLPLYKVENVVKNRNTK